MIGNFIQPNISQSIINVYYGHFKFYASIGAFESMDVILLFFK